MERKKLVLLPIILLGLLLPSCNNGPDTSSSPDVSSGTPSESTPEPVQLIAPVLTLNEDNDGLIWNNVENAVSYQLKVNDGEYADATDYAFVDDIGSYSIVVKAIGDGTNYSDSEPSLPYAYSTSAISLSNLSRDGMLVSWTAVAYQTEISFGGGEYVIIEETSYTATESGIVSIRASAGFDAENKINYVGESIVKSCPVVSAAPSSITLEDVEDKTNTDLQELWIASKYDNGWVPTSGVASVSYEALGENNIKSMKLDFWKNGSAFRYSRNINYNVAYNALSLLIKGDDEIDFTLRLNDLDTGIYADYRISDASSNWVYHVVRFDDAGWSVTIGGNTFTLAQAADYLGYESAGEAITVFDQFQILLPSLYVDGGPKTYVVVDDIKFLNDDTPSQAEMHYDLEGKYTGELSGTIFRLSANAGIGMVETLNLATNLQIPVVVETDDDNVNIKSSGDDGAALNYQGKVSYYGDKISYVSASGTYAAYVANLNVSRVKQLDDFESYTETGIGYDANHSADARTGLRANYYCDYYSGSASNPSPVGGNNWSLMGSSDYLALEQANAHSGSQSAKLKRSGSAGDMRFLNYNSYSGINPGFGAGNSKFSFWAKGDTYDTTFRLRVYYVSPVNASNQVDGSLSVTTDVVVPGGSDWMHYTMDINASRVVFGYSMTLRVNWDHTSNGYPLVDDIELYSANPWATYQV